MSASNQSQKVNIPPLLIQRDIKPNVTESVYFETPTLKMLIALNGPYYSSTKTNDDSKMDINIKIKIPSYCNVSQTSITNNESQLEEMLTKHFIISKYPRTKLEILIEVFEFQSDYLPYAVMGISLCACYANIEQKGLLTCCKVIIDENQKVIVDPLLVNEKSSISKFVVGCNIALKENFMFKQDGTCSSLLLKKAIASAIKICEVYQDFIIKKL